MNHATTRLTAPSVSAQLGPSSVLAQLADVRAFILYRLEPRADGKLDKIPTSPTQGGNIDPHVASEWMLPAEAAMWAELYNAQPLPPHVSGYGVGVVISEEIVLPNGRRLFALDIDACRDGDAWAPHAAAFLSKLPGAGVEVSVSGNGLHAFGTYSGPRPEHGTRNRTYRLELYSRLRFIACTGFGAVGDCLRDLTAELHALALEFFPPHDDTEYGDELTTAPVSDWLGPDDDDELLRRALQSTSAAAVFGGKASFADLFNANEAALARAFPRQQHGTYDASAADQALANHCAFWTGNNGERMLRLMQRSKLARSKWERTGYLRNTIQRACASTRRWYKDPRASSQPDGAVDVPAGTPGQTERDPRPVILLRGGEFDRYTEQAEQLLADTLYVHGHRLVRIGRAAEISNDALLDAAGTKREAAQAVCIPVSAGWLRRVLMQRAQFWKYDKRAREWERRDCPKEVPENIVAQEAWPAFRSLIAISPVPVLRPDLSVWLQPGYDAATEIYYQPTMTVPQFPPTPTRDDALQSLARLREPFNEFPYASAESESVFIAHVIASVLRASFDTSPIFLYTSPIAATGKTLLAGMPNRIAYGVSPAHSPYSEGDELRKVLFSSLLAGDAALTLDNVPNGHKVRAPGLCNFATSATVADRILGASENRKVPNRCIVVMTGNNITPVSDMARRSLVCRLDVNAESARGREFRIHDLPRYVRERRAQLIVDVLTVVRAYAFAGRPKVARALESFEEWSRLVRDPLMWLGLADPVASQETQTDDELAPLQGAFAAIAAVTQLQGFAFTTAQLACNLQPTLREALMNAGCSEPNDAKKLGYWLREQKDRVAAGWKLVSERSSHRGLASWRLRAA